MDWIDGGVEVNYWVEWGGQVSYFRERSDGVITGLMYRTEKGTPQLLTLALASPTPPPQSFAHSRPCHASALGPHFAPVSLPTLVLRIFLISLSLPVTNHDCAAPLYSHSFPLCLP